MANIGTKIFTWLHGRYLGADEFGNHYYEARKAGDDGRKRRWVIYAAAAEPSTVPANWHGWLHHTTDKLPTVQERQRLSWQKPHQPNLTGTDQRHLPPGHLARGGHRAVSASGDYLPWNPS
jgi:NADH:ubiquinone oxidoreductase subunit